MTDPSGSNIFQDKLVSENLPAIMTHFSVQWSFLGYPSQDQKIKMTFFIIFDKRRY